MHYQAMVDTEHDLGWKLFLREREEQINDWL